eukprot:GHVH01015984.1.p2 GENE.GHVH01015984.1~~GHVH01015984.1.p2  ORF type:complete len:246 (+),score=32.72 GHVH01015984.1:251-988(+)
MSVLVHLVVVNAIIPSDPVRSRLAPSLPGSIYGGHHGDFLAGGIENLSVEHKDISDAALKAVESGTFPACKNLVGRGTCDPTSKVRRCIGCARGKNEGCPGSDAFRPSINWPDVQWIFDDSLMGQSFQIDREMTKTGGMFGVGHAMNYIGFGKKEKMICTVRHLSRDEVLALRNDIMEMELNAEKEQALSRLYEESTQRHPKEWRVEDSDYVSLLNSALGILALVGLLVGIIYTQQKRSREKVAF